MSNEQMNYFSLYEQNTPTNETLEIIFTPEEHTISMTTPF